MKTAIRLVSRPWLAVLALTLAAVADLHADTTCAAEGVRPR